MDPIILIEVEYGGAQQMVALDAIEYIRSDSAGIGDYRPQTYLRTKTGHVFYSSKSYDEVKEAIVAALSNIYNEG